MKWEPVALMVLLIGLGLWLVWGAQDMGVKPAAGAEVVPLRVGSERGVVEVVKEQGDVRVRILLRNGFRSESMTLDEFRARFGEEVAKDVSDGQSHPVLRMFNITSWGSFVWVLVGLVGQTAFFGRMMIQWIVSESRKESVVPSIFWWLSLGGGVMLFVYFVWRQDVVGVLGQSSGVVIYARNLRLLAKRRRAMANGS